MSATDSCVIHRYPPQSESAGVRRSTSYVRFRIFRVREQVHCLGFCFPDVVCSVLPDVPYGNACCLSGKIP